MNREQIIRKRLVELVDALLARYEGSLLPDADAATLGAIVEVQQIERWAGHDLPQMSSGDLSAMNDLVDALLRVDAGTYGICARCANPIGYQRLIESPTSVSCASCARDEAWRPSRAPG
jgi:hypothetical protein